MIKACFILILALAAGFAFAQGNYYDGVIDLTGQELYLALRALISTNSYSNYDGAKVQLFQVLDNVDGNVTCIYTGQVYYVGYNYNGSSDPNTEHTYAQSWFSPPESTIKRADLHHLFPSNALVNNYRGNLPLFTVANHATANVYYTYTPWQSYRGPNAAGITVFEAADETKGNIARALLYFNTRYNDTLTQQNVDMIPDLVQWHYQDPPDAAEIARNQGIHNFQNNRNPYVDHPEFVGRIWGGSATSEEVASPSPNLSLSDIYPNPSPGRTTLVLDSKHSQSVRLEIYNVKGQQVASQNRTLSPGSNELVWEGNDAQGKRLPAGIYLIRISSTDSVLTARILLN